MSGGTRGEIGRILLNGTDWRMKEFVGLDWVWRDSVKQDSPDTRWWYPASVPGSVLHDLRENGLVPDPYFEKNSMLAEWVPGRTWVYRKRFFVPEELKGQRIALVFEGIDYSAEIFLNGRSLGKQEGMFTAWSAEVGGMLQFGAENLLAVVIDPAPQEQPQVGRTSLVHTHKSRMTYWWDFCPRMIHQGIWQDVYLKVTGACIFTDVQIKSRLMDGYRRAEVRFFIQTNAPDGARVSGRFGKTAFAAVLQGGTAEAEIVIEEPRLWWCNGQGEPYEYEAEAVLLSPEGIPSDRWSCRYGLREITFEPNEGVAPGRERDGAFLLRLNGRELYMNGYNWVPADAMYGAADEAKIAHLIRLAKEAGANILRVWGGGLIERASFYRKCAEAGILVWQEFILSSSGIENRPSEEAGYLELMRRESEEIIKSRRNCTALAAWCGGNELQELDGTPLDERHPLLHMLGEQVRRLDPGRRWLPTSPSGGVFLNSFENLERCPEELFDVHGPWEHQGLEKQCGLYNSGTCRLHSEFGAEGMTNYETLRRTAAAEHWMPAGKDNAVYFHKGAWWNNEPLVQKTFGGGLKEIEQIRRASQFMQYEGLKYAVECDRRRAPACGGSFPWQFNEPYPNLFCTSSVDYYGNPKPAYYGVKKAYAPFLICAAFESPSLAGKDMLEADIWTAANACGQEGAACTAVAQVFHIQGKKIAEQRWHMGRPGLRAENAGRIRIALPQPEDGKPSLWLLRLTLYGEDGAQRLAENEYLFTGKQDFREVFSIPEANVQAWRREGKLRLQNIGETAALFLFVSSERGPRVYWQENYVCLLPGEVREIFCEGNTEKASVQALNLGYRALP